MPEIINTILPVFIICLIIQVIGFIVAFALKTDKLTDISYGGSFLILALIEIFTKPLNTIALIINFAVVLWGLRIAGYLFIRINKMKSDKRFDGIRENFLKFAGFWLLQAVTVTIVSLPNILIAETSINNSFGIFQILGLVISSIALLIETVADMQKFRFKNTPEGQNSWTKVGLWQLSRHPNYFGEIAFWWGLLIMLIGNVSGIVFAISLIGPLFITLLICFVSGIPIIEKRYDEKFKGNEEYLKYKKNTNLLIPLPFKIF